MHTVLLSAASSEFIFIIVPAPKGNKDILEFLFEIGGEVATDKKVSKWIRYPIFTLLIIFYSAIILGILFIGINYINENIWLSIFLIVVSLLLFISTIFAIKRTACCTLFLSNSLKDSTSRNASKVLYL